MIKAYNNGVYDIAVPVYLDTTALFGSFSTGDSTSGGSSATSYHPYTLLGTNCAYMRLILFLIILSILTSCDNSKSQKIFVKGDLESKSEVFIELKIRTDFITPAGKTITLIESNENGQFNLEIEADRTQQYELLIGEKSNKIYLSPGYHYSLQFDSEFEIVSIDSEDPTNHQIELIDSKVMEFFSFYIKSSRDDQTTSDSIRSFTNLDFGHINNYVKDYLKYSIGTLNFRRYKTKLDSAELDSIELIYFIKSPIGYANPKYFTLLSWYYWEIFNSPDLGHVPFSRDAEPYEQYLKDLTFIPNDTVRQLAILKASRSAFRSPWGGDKNKIVKVVEEIQANPLSPTISQISDNLLIKYGDELLGKTAPSFHLVNLDSNIVDLSSIQDKYVLLDFWYIGCRPCMKAMPIKKLLSDSLQSKLFVISINPRNEVDKIKEWLLKYPDFDWTFLSAYKNQSIVDYFRVNGYPTYILLDKTGKIVFAPSEFDLEILKEDIFTIVQGSD